MVETLMSKQFKRRAGRALAVACAISLFGTGCAAGQEAQRDQEQLDVLKERVEEVERTNGRLTVRMEELEDQLFLLNDRVESHRIALQRRAYQQRQQRYAYNDARRAPAPAPESYYQQPSAYNQPAPRRPVTRIPLSQPQGDVAAPARQPQRAPARPEASQRGQREEEAEIVITDEDFRKFAGTPRREPASPARAAQPPVTDEKLKTTAEKKGGAVKKSSPAPEKPAVAEPSQPKRSGLRLYKDSLAAYRAGRFQEALAGFEAFLAEGPKQDYVDNALYWIGECHYGLGQYDQAIQHFERVLREQPDGNKVPDAMLKMSLALDRVGQSERASSMLEALTQRYPMTNAARLGQKRLAERQ